MIANNGVSSIGHSLHQANLSNADLSSLIAETKLQRSLTDRLVRSEVSERIDSATCPRDASRLRSIQGRGAGAWLDAIPSSQKFAFKPKEFQSAAFMRLGLLVVSSNWVQKCECGKELDPAGYHLMTCKTGERPVWAHNTIVNVWSECLSQLHINHKNHKKEPRERYCNCEDRPDIAITDPETGSDVELDVSLAHPWCADILSRAARDDGGAAVRREEKKVEKYQTKVIPGGLSLNFVLLVMEYFGYWAKQAQIFLSQLSQLDINVDSNCTQDFKRYWRRRFAVALQKCNAKVLIRKMNRTQIL